MKKFTLIKYLLIAILFYNCSGKSSRKPEAQYPLDIADTVKHFPASSQTKPMLFESAFMKGTSLKVKDKNANLYGVTAGKLRVTGGYIIACDPLHIKEYGKPFTQLFPTGEFPVQLSVVNVEDYETIAFGRIVFSDEPVARWENALQAGQAPIPFGGEKFYGYGVDAGIVVFFDKDALPSLNTDSLANMDTQLYREMNKHKHNGWKYAMYNAGNYNLAAFTTGFGDGRYATYIGFDAAGKPCRLLTDFEIFDWKNM